MHLIGNEDLLDLRKVAFLCSRRFPHEAAEKAYRWADTQRAAGNCVISGYHSPIEKEVLCRLLQGSQPIIIALAQGLNRLDPAWERHLAAGRLLVISRYAKSVSHPCESKCYQRNKMMIDLADSIVIAHASPGGSLERLCSDYLDKLVLL
ncbi:DNA-processing protein DprA [Geomonas propionica]|uniref:DNA-processing protein DprA n=1 Tax=Geomonas propionica TaxID=2798582 RepID=A0ABS0YVW8_9BACT|nr:DNA-processing protein DprA [Geomonas propionica]MBJ6801650.1 DNA-processing protein DprA [Geomonas propionica]